MTHLLAVVLIALTAMSCHAEGPARPVEIGMLVHFRGADAASIERQFDLMAAMNVKWVRLDIDWAVIESERGRFDWAQTDRFVDAALARQMNVLAVLAFTPEWARQPAPGPAKSSRHLRPRNLADYGDFARIATARYASRGVHSWEIWNEPNIRHFWPPRPDADQYGELFRVAADAIRDVDPQAIILIGGLSPKFEVPGSEIEPAAYLEQLYGNGTAQLADGVAAHPYTFPKLPMDTQQRTEGGFSELPALHAVMVRHGDGLKKVWITEFGAPTGTGTHSVSEEDQAASLAQARKLVAGWYWAGPLIFYELVDGGTDPTDIAENFGVLRADLTPKAAARALMASGGGG